MNLVLKTLFVSLLLLVLVAPALAGEVSLSAGGSLKEVINELCERFVRSHPGVRITRNYGGSGQLAKQIESGAPADIFIPANVEWMEYLKGRKLVQAGSIGTFGYNTLVFAGTPGKASKLQDLLKLERIAIGSPRSVPAGEYAMQAMKKAGLDRQLQKKLVMAKDVRECLMYAERGEVDGAFVYRTDALQAKKARILFTVPAESYPRVVYPMALSAAGAKNSDAVALLAYLRGSDAGSVLTRYGFAAR